ncbi:coiled-coil-helix-coiled-coil-helix domain-containing protein 7 [Pogona vitticeps]|uniref:Coiled-coil-helix-coiled-coil-helix domain-containing protein 7 n=1 Tax=Pogona vitticeps TaxID=103695 RepID=A0A6J0VAT2_9SAUR|nr:coiled-coil-helix-coiled-coil-helix domain-containing protein 7 [Pogona vitticeps]
MSKKPQRFLDPDTNPCLPESDASNKCLIKTNYSKDMCAPCFLRYRNCRIFWSKIMAQRRRDGIQPAMPTAEERENILASIGKMPY